MVKLAYVDPKTGEIFEMEAVCPFRSITNLKKDQLVDGENYKKGTSITTLEGYEPLGSIVARCTRQLTSRSGTIYTVLDRDALKAEETQTGIYEASNAKTLDEAFNTMDPTDEQGFDLSDASIIKENLVKKSNLSTERASETPLNVKASDGTVGKSDSQNSTTQEADFPEQKNYENHI